MSRVCQLTGKKTTVGNNVSHSNKVLSWIPNISNIANSTKSIKEVGIMASDIRLFEENELFTSFILFFSSLL